MVSSSKIHNLRIPGPTTLYPEVQKAMASPAFTHRGADFEKLINDVTEKLKEVFHTKGDVLLLSASGTGGLEAAIANTLSPHDKIIAVSIGTFGDRFAKIAKVYGAEVIDIKFEFGTAADPLEIQKALIKNPDAKAVLVTHNETSTGVTNDLETIAKIVKEHSDALLIVDGVSSVAAIPLPTDEWKCDVVITASQKGFGTPPGLSMISMSDKAWKYYEKSEMPKFYFDLGKAKISLSKKQTPFTPSTHLIAGLDIGLKLMLKETLPVIIQRHKRTAEKVRKAVKEMGLSLLAPESHASPVLTSVKTERTPEIIEKMRERGIELAGGYGPLKGKIFRIGHLGFFTDEEIDEALSNLEEVVKQSS
jgi:aspartate aminotransferase-like enzyme